MSLQWRQKMRENRLRPMPGLYQGRAPGTDESVSLQAPRTGDPGGVQESHHRRRQDVVCIRSNRHVEGGNQIIESGMDRHAVMSCLACLWHGFHSNTLCFPALVPLSSSEPCRVLVTAC